VLLTALFNLPALGCALASLQHEEVLDCELHPLKALVFADAALAAVHISMAFYLQLRLVRGLRSSTGTEEQLSAKELLARAGHIVLYDVAFCLYFFVFVGAFALQCVGLTWISGCNAGTPLPAVAAGMLVAFALLASFFSFLWVCARMCEKCCGSLTSCLWGALGGGRGAARTVRATGAGLRAQIQQPLTASAPPAGQLAAPVQGVPVTWEHQQEQQHREPQQEHMG